MSTKDPYVIASWVENQDEDLELNGLWVNSYDQYLSCWTKDVDRVTIFTSDRAAKNYIKNSLRLRERGAWVPAEPYVMTKDEFDRMMIEQQLESML